MTTWGPEAGKIRVGIDVSMSPATVTASTTQVTLTWTVTVQTVRWYFADNQTVTVSNAASGKVDYRKQDPQYTGDWPTVVGTLKTTVTPSASAPITKKLTATASGLVTGGTPAVTAAFTVPKKPTPPDVFQPPAEPSKPATGTPAGTVVDKPQSVPTTPAPAPTVPALPAPEPSDAQRMDLAALEPVLVWGDDHYDAFPFAASNGSTILGTWRHASAHDVDRNASIMLTSSRDGGRTYETPWPWDDGKKGAQVERTPAGLAWDATRKQWVMSHTWREYASATSKDVVRRWTTFQTSTDDGKAWKAPTKNTVDTALAAWFFANDLKIAGSLWVVAGYGRLANGTYSRCMTTTSTDGGQSWSPTVEVQGVPAGSAFSEPKVARLQNGSWLMLMRDAQADNICSARSSDGVTWTYTGVAIAGYTGNPEVAVMPDGAVIAILRTPDPSKNPLKLGFYRWAFSLDNGGTWTVRSDFADTIRRDVYASIVPLADGSAAVLFAAEDDPDQAWKSASVWATRFVAQKLSLSLDFVGDMPVVSVSTADRSIVSRVMTDPQTGEETLERVRYRALDGYTFKDFEVQQGALVSYRAGNQTTEPVRIPTLPRSILIHPLEPERLSMRVDIDDDGERLHGAEVTVTHLPHSQYAVVRKSGRRQKPTGQTRIITYTLQEKERFLDLVDDLTPLFWSQAPGYDLPEWIQPLNIREARAVQYRAFDDNDEADMAQWRIWTMEWARIRRPSALALPVRRRIRDVHQAAQSLQIKYQEA